MTRRNRLIPRRDMPVFRDLARSADRYRPPPGLHEAADVSVSLGLPLLLTGDPGTGKTQAGYHLAHRYGIPPGQIFRLDVHSATTARDLTASVDTVAYFHAAQDPRRAGEDIDPEDYLIRGPLYRAYTASATGCLVLIDEVDKAPREFPNDLLSTLDQHTFTIQELRREITLAPDQPPPFVVITSNTERSLPHPFLRRCIYYHIEFTPALLRQAVEAHRDDLTLERALVHAAIERFVALRDGPISLSKKPSTGEFLHWLHALQSVDGLDADTLRALPVGALPHLPALIKTHDDLERLRHS